jgi:hypothetical protein
MPMLFDTGYPSSFGSSLSFLFRKKENVHRFKAKVNHAKAKDAKKRSKKLKQRFTLRLGVRRFYPYRPCGTLLKSASI